MKKEFSTAEIYAVKISLKGVKPMVWRRVQVRSDCTLRELHYVIQIAMGWGHAHLHEFTIDGESYGEPNAMEGGFGDETQDDSKVRLNRVAGPGSKFEYCYDFGDDWRHTIKIENIALVLEGAKTPFCLTGVGACPPEDCGGVWGYAELLETLAGADSAEKDEMLEWLGGDIEPAWFDLEEVNVRLGPLQK